jgi:transcriptional regulator with XRE-family HTH domain
MQTIYERIEALIASKRMTKKAFCQQMGISTGNFGDWKRGVSIPSTKKLIEIAQYFDVSLDWLMTGRERGASDGIRELPNGYSPEGGQPDAWMEQLTEEERAFIREYLEFTEYRRSKGQS